MKITIENLITKLGEHIDAKVMPGLSNEMTRFALGFSKSLILGNTRAKLEALPCDGTVRDADGNIDVDVLRTCIRDGFAAAGSVKILGIRFEKEDAEAFLDTL